MFNFNNIALAVKWHIRAVTMFIKAAQNGSKDSQKYLKKAGIDW